MAFVPTSDEQKTSQEVWDRYRYAIDSGHKEFVLQADRVRKFLAGDQWDASVLTRLREQGRPALTFNMLLPTLKAVMTQHINSRVELTALPVETTADDVSTVLTKVFKHVQRDTQLDWRITELLQSGLVTSRGYLDMRLDFANNLRGNITITSLNSKNVMPDPDATDVDPDTWNDVLVSKWLSIDEIELLYGKDKADYLRAKSGSTQLAREDDTGAVWRDRFGSFTSNNGNPAYGGAERKGSYVRVIERQFWRNEMVDHFVDVATGDMDPVPASWSPEDIQQHLQQNPTLGTFKKLARRVRWQHTADTIMLHDEWSPFRHFSVIPYFPIFDGAKPIGMMEHLIGAQELLNKTTSQELHVVNTTANSGYIVKSGSLLNMSIDELSKRGAETGLVMEVAQDVENAVEKIQPNAYPSGLDRLSYKAGEFIKSISNVSDSMLGQDRADVAAKAILAKQQVGSQNYAMELDNLRRSMFVLGRNMLDIIQEFYTEPRLLHIIGDDLTGQTEPLQINTYDEATGKVHNDLSLGRYQVAVSVVPSRDVMEDSEFEQAARLRELGVAIDDTVLIKNSRLRDRGAIIQQMQAAAQSPEAQQQQQLATEREQLVNQQMAADIAKTQAETEHKTAKADSEEAKIAQNAAKLDLEVSKNEAGGDDGGAAQQRLQSQQLHEQKMAQNRETHDQKMALTLRQNALNTAIKSHNQLQSNGQQQESSQ